MVVPFLISCFISSYEIHKSSKSVTPKRSIWFWWRCCCCCWCGCQHFYIHKSREGFFPSGKSAMLWFSFVHSWHSFWVVFFSFGHVSLLRYCMHVVCIHLGFQSNRKGSFKMSFKYAAYYYTHTHIYTHIPRKKVNL